MRKSVLIFSLIFTLNYILSAQNKHFVWADNIGGEGSGYGQSVMADEEGNVYTLGVFEGELDFNPGEEVFNLESNGGKDVFLQKLNSNGVFIWAKSFGGETDVYGNALVLDSNGDIIIIGSFSNVAVFDFDDDVNDVNSKGLEDVFIEKVSKEGEFVWVKTFGGRFSDIGSSIAIDNEDNIYTTGTYSLDVDFDPGKERFEMKSLGNTDVFIQKLNHEGVFMWSKSIGGLGYDYGSFIKTDKQQNIYLTGSFEGKADFDPSSEATNFHLSKGGSDLFVEKLDLHGKLVWTKVLGATQNEAGYSLALDEDQYVYITGFFRGSLKLDINGQSVKLKSKGKEDILTIKQDSKGELLWVKSMGGKGSDLGNSIFIDHHGDVFTTGSFSGSVDFNPNKDGYRLVSAGGDDVFIQKLGADGAFEWADKIGGTGNDRGYSIFVDKNSEIYATGSFEKTVIIQLEDETKKMSSKGKEDIFIVK
jgi:hypothetical protein